MDILDLQFYSMRKSPIFGGKGEKFQKFFSINSSFVFPTLKASMLEGLYLLSLETLSIANMDMPSEKSLFHAQPPKNVGKIVKKFCCNYLQNIL